MRTERENLAEMTPEDIHLPAYQGQCVKVSVINGAKAHMLTSMLLEPASYCQDFIDLACYSFLIESRNCKRKVLFDLAFMKDLEARAPPVLRGFLSGDKPVMRIDEFHHIPDILETHGIELSEINAIIWSHAHVDHVGDPSVFPPTTDLVAGLGLKARCIPGYPANPESVILDSAFRGRSVREIDFSNSDVTIGGFRAVDFFNDGSFWLLEAPGHTGQHICALCRTTAESWVLLGGDSCHYVGQIRPNRFRPLPEGMPANLSSRLSESQDLINTHMSRLLQRTKRGSFFDIAPGAQEDQEKAEQTLEKLKLFDGRDDVMIIIAHDLSLMDVLEFFPHDINDWQVKDWAQRGRWLFLNGLQDAALSS